MLLFGPRGIKERLMGRFKPKRGREKENEAVARIVMDTKTFHECCQCTGGFKNPDSQAVSSKAQSMHPGAFSTPR